MNYKRLKPTLVLCLALLGVAKARGHGTPIDISVRAATGQVRVSAGFDAGEFDSHPVFGLSTDLPGFGVTDPNDNGILADDVMGMRVTQGLLYWNGTELSSTSATLTINSAETSDNYTVTEQTELQTGLDWAVYPQNAPADWDADGLYQLSSGAVGIYGLVVQVTVTRDANELIASEPFVIPMIHGSWTFNEEVAAIGLLQDTIIPPDAADFNRDWSVDHADLSIWSDHFGSSANVSLVQGDANESGQVDGADFLQWQRSYDAGETSLQAFSVSEIARVPEPGSGLLAMLVSSLLLASARRR